MVHGVGTPGPCVTHNGVDTGRICNLLLCRRHVQDLETEPVFPPHSPHELHCWRNLSAGRAAAASQSPLRLIRQPVRVMPAAMLVLAVFLHSGAISDAKHWSMRTGGGFATDRRNVPIVSSSDLPA